MDSWTRLAETGRHHNPSRSVMVPIMDYRVRIVYDIKPAYVKFTIKSNTKREAYNLGLSARMRRSYGNTVE